MPEPQTTPAQARRPGASLADVARLAGVSATTVSRVSTGADTVRPETRTRVLEAMRAVGYSPNVAARALKYGSFRSIGIIAHRLARTGESLTVEAVVEAARAEGYTVSLVDLPSPTPLELSAAATHLSGQAVDGLVVIRAEVSTAEELRLPPRLPVVTSDSQFVGHHAAVAADQQGGSRAAVEHLLALGHPTVHHLAGPPGSWPARLRTETWRQTLQQAGRPVPEPFAGDWTAASGLAAAGRVAADPRVTAVWCANDEMAAGLVRGLHERGVAVPGEVSVVGFDDIPVAAYLWPPLTTVVQDFPEIGRRLVELLVRQIRDHEDQTDVHSVVPAHLVVRASTAAHRPR